MRYVVTLESYLLESAQEVRDRMRSAKRPCSLLHDECGEYCLVFDNVTDALLCEQELGIGGEW